MDGFLVRTGLLIHLIFLSTYGFEPLQWSASEYQSGVADYLLGITSASPSKPDVVFSHLLSAGRYSFSFSPEMDLDHSRRIVSVNEEGFFKGLIWNIPIKNLSIKWDDVQGMERSLSFIDFLHVNYYLDALMSHYYGVDSRQIDQDKLYILFSSGLLEENNKNLVISDTLTSLINTFYVRPIDLKSFFENFYQEIIITDNKNDPDKISAYFYLGTMSLAQKAGWHAEKHSQEDFYPKQTLKNGPFTFGMPPLL